MATKERASKVFVRLDIYTPKHTRFIKVRLLFCSDRFIVKTLQTEHPPKGPGWMKCPLCRGYQLRGCFFCLKRGSHGMGNDIPSEGLLDLLGCYI